MSLKEELLNAAKPFLMKEGLESSKEIIAKNSTSFDEMGMANSKPGEFSQEEITDPENLVNVSKMSNDNNFNANTEESETVVSVLGIDDNSIDSLADLINLGTGASCEYNDEEKNEYPKLSQVIESILRKKDQALFENLEEADLEEAMVDDWPGFVPAQPGIGKWANALMSRVRANMSAIRDGRIQVPQNVKDNWQRYVDAYKQYNISNIGSPIFMKILRAVAAKSSNPEFIDNPTPEDCAAFGEALNAALRAKGGADLSFDFEPGMSLAQTLDKSSKNYQVRAAFQKAYTDALDQGTARGGHYGTIRDFGGFDNTETPVETPAAPVTSALSNEDIALLQANDIDPNNPDAEKILAILKKMNPVSTAKKPAAKKGKLAKALESVLAESDYAGNLSYNPDKRLNASDILNAVKNAVKPELAAKLSVVKNVDANEDPSYAIQNIDEKDLPEKIEIDTNTDKKVVLKKDGNSYKFDK